uniref:Uncharacterized protein n=1 Tax=Anguilla anguilla TaxID=7936 RepID=A0A0E9TA03_ANGAN
MARLRSCQTQSASVPTVARFFLSWSSRKLFRIG